MNDVWFAEDTAFTVALNNVELSNEVAALPEVQGFGNVNSLRQALLLFHSRALLCVK